MLTAADVGEVKEVSVQAKNGLAVTGNTVTVDTKGKATDSDGGTGGGGDDTTGGSDSDGDGDGDTVIDPTGKPKVSNLRMAGKLEVGESLSATYAFNANGGDTNDRSTYAWGNEGETAAAVPAGQTVATSGVVPAVMLTAADVGEVKEVSVQAKNGLAVTGNTVTVDTKGKATDSDGGTGGGGDDTTGGSDSDGDGDGDTVIDPTGKPKVSNLRMAGKLEVGESLSATYAFNANGGDTNDRSTYAWGNEGETAAAVPAGQTVATSGVVPAVMLTAADVGEVKEVSVQAKNGLAVTGNTVTVDAKGKATDSDGGTGGGGDDTTGGSDSDGDGDGDTVIDPTSIKIRVVFSSSANLADNGVNGVHPVVNNDEMTAECQIAGEAAFKQCDSRFDLQWHVNAMPVVGANLPTFIGRSEHQGQEVQVEATYKS
ncbi:hypothetical protein [Aeromonas veronii]|uniref:hypothetical protein n=1 Tax=Aeromonas veronii TaxID=654 RepID=UPI0035BA09CB